MGNNKAIISRLEALFSEAESLPELQEDTLPFEDAVAFKSARNQRAIFHTLAENALDAISVSDLEGRLTYSNCACYKLFGYDHATREMEALSLASLWPAEEASAFTYQVFPQATINGWKGEARQKRRDGSLFDAYLTIFPVLDEAGQRIGIATIIRDVSERKALESAYDAAYTRRTQQVQLITEVAQAIAAAPTLDELYRRVVNLIKERFSYYQVQILRYDAELDAMQVVESYLPQIEVEGHCSTYTAGAAVAASATGQPVLVPDVSLNPHWEAHSGLPAVEGELAVPIRLRGQVLCVLDVLSDRAGALTKEDEIILLDLAGQIASAIENARLLEEANTFRQFAGAREGIGWITLEGHLIIYANPTFCSILGEAKPEDTFGKPITAYCPADLHERIQNEILPTVMREGQWVGELALCSTTGKIIPTMHSIFLVRDGNGTPLYLANVVTDITEQKRAELLMDKRVRQINCLNSVGRQIEQTPPIPELLQWVAECIPTGMQYPDVCAATIEFEGQVYGANEETGCPWQITEPLRIGGELLGRIHVSSTRKYEFLEEDRVLLGDIARRVSSYVESRRLLEQTQAMLGEVKSTHKHYVPEQRTEVAPPAHIAPTDEPVKPEPGATLFGDNGADARPASNRVSAILRSVWRHMTTRLFVLVALLLVATTLVWTLCVQVWVRHPPVAAAARSISTPVLPTATVSPGGGSSNPAMLRPTSLPTALPPTAIPPTAAPPSSSSISTLPTTLPPTAMPSASALPLPSTSPSTPPPTSISASSQSAEFVVSEPFPTPSLEMMAAFSSTLPMPTPVTPVPVSADAINIVVLGSDQRPDWAEWHTDAVHIVSIQRDRGAVSVLSIPRDLYLYIPGVNRMSRINFADFWGESYDYAGQGPALVRDTLLYNLGIRVDYYVRTNFDGLISIVDTLGGIDVPVHCRLSDNWPYPDESGQYPILTLEPGIQHMDGETALWYSRSRLTSSVFAREYRQQQVLQAIWRKGRDAGLLSQIEVLWRQKRDLVETDLTLPEIIGLAQVGLALRDENIRFYNINANMVTPWITPYGGNVFLPRWENIQPVLAEALAPIPEGRLSRTYMPIEVWNGTPNQSWELLAADRLSRVGFPAVVGEPDRRDYAQTQLIVFSASSKGTGVEYLQQMFGIPDDRVVYQPGSSSRLGFRLIVGADYQTCP